MANQAFQIPPALKLIDNPTPAELKQLVAERMPNARKTRYDNLNVQTRVVARSKGSTFLVMDEPDGQNQSITHEQAVEMAARQDEYIAAQEMVLIDGWIGNHSDFRTRARLYIEAANANIAAMQQQLYFHGDEEADRKGVV